MSSFPETSTMLLARLAERETGIDQSAWRIFFDRYQPVMVEYARIAHQEKNSRTFVFTSDILKGVTLGGKGAKGSKGSKGSKW